MGNGSLTTGLLGRLYLQIFHQYPCIQYLACNIYQNCNIVSVRKPYSLILSFVLCSADGQGYHFHREEICQICHDTCLICNHICPNCMNICPNCKDICLQHCPGTHTVICPLQIGKVDGQTCNFQRRKFVK